MGNVYQNGFDVAATAGLSNAGQWWLEIFESDNSTFNASGSNPQQPPQSTWSRAGTTVTGIVSSWTSDGTGEEFAQVEARVSDPSTPSTQEQFVRWDGNDGGNLPYTTSLGESIDITGGALDALDPGYAEMLVQGIDNISVEYVIKDGGGSILPSGGTINPGDSAHVSLLYGGGTLQIGADLSFSNNSGSSWSVEEVEVRVDSSQNVIFESSSFSASVPSGGTLTFTQLEDSVTNLQ